jgi:hypothetical protein
VLATSYAGRAVVAASGPASIQAQNKISYFDSARSSDTA